MERLIFSLSDGNKSSAGCLQSVGTSINVQVSKSLYNNCTDTSTSVQFNQWYSCTFVGGTMDDDFVAAHGSLHIAHELSSSNGQRLATRDESFAFPRGNAYGSVIGSSIFPCSIVQDYTAEPAGSRAVHCLSRCTRIADDSVRRLQKWLRT